ncbi:MAG: MBL fold metallo-hydrolase [Gammaproteobacteria bacterium]|nr:MBL fold metallo-hydrolase [Gammaproteobacteria bacterium]
MPYLSDNNGEFSVDLRSAPGGGRRVTQLIWGDFLHDTGNRSDGFAEVSARGRTGWIPENRITNIGLLEFYIIDVGQGDGVLIRTPDDKWHLIDAGVSNDRQEIGKGAVNFIRWKFNRDLRKSAEFASVVLSHPDFDHYGGLINLLSGDLGDGSAHFPVTVHNYYHSGMGRFDSTYALGMHHRGEIDSFPVGGFRLRRKDSFITELLGNHDSFANSAHPFSGSFADLAQLIVNETENSNRIGIVDGQLGWFPGYADTDAVQGPQNTDLTIRLLGPIFENFEDDNGDSHIGLRKLASESITRNGHSVILRFDYGDARILMTGDLNSESQRLLLSYIEPDEFSSDVVKGCHHGSEDVFLEFIEAMEARATVISSGDNEDYAHPRPAILGASAYYGRPSKTTDNKFLPPLIYSTELSRSVKLKKVDRVRVDHDDDDDTRMRSYPMDRAQVRPRNSKYRNFSTTPVATDLVYGLVNVRTDGKNIMIATMEEKGTEFDIKTFVAGVNAN